MNERIAISFARGGAGFPVCHLGEEGLIFAYETSAQPLGFAIGLTPENDIVKRRMARVRQIEDWAGGEFRLAVTREGDALVVSGGGKRKPAESLPPGRYTLRFAVSETRLANPSCVVEIPRNGETQVPLEVCPPDIGFALIDPSQWDGEVLEICRHASSRVDNMDPVSWLGQPLPRISRKACLLNLLAKARTLPSARRGESLCPSISSIRWADVDRIDVQATPELAAKLRSRPDWKDALPIHPSHAENMARIFGGRPDDYSVESFREPVALHSMQVVVATHKRTGATYAEIDIDLGNPQIDLAGFCVHVGELLDPGRTNHLDLYGGLRTGVTSDFLYYRLEQASEQAAGTR